MIHKATLRRGLTLVELVVVLTILAILTTIAITATDQFIDQARYDATQRTLQSIQDGILGPTNQRAGDGSPVSSGFVANMGRLPWVVDAVNDPLRELWDPNAIAAPSGTPIPAVYSLQTTAISTTNPSTTAVLMNAPGSPYNGTGAALALQVPLTYGWRGPYVNLSSGSNGRLLDGWGNPFDSLQTTTFLNVRNSPATLGSPILVVRSLGAENAVDPATFPAGFSAYNIDQYAPSQLSSPPTLNLVNFASQITGGAGISISGQVQAYSNAATAPFVISNATYASGVATVTVTGTFTAAQQQTITVLGTTATGGGATGYNGTFSISTINSTGSGTTQITYSLGTNPGTYTAGSGGTVTALLPPSMTAPTAIGANDAVMIVLFAPVNGFLTAFPVINSVTNLPYFPCGTPLTFAYPTVVTGTSGAQSIQLGSRAIQAYQFDSLTTSPTYGWIRKRSPLVNLIVPPGGVQPQTLILPLSNEF